MQNRQPSTRRDALGIAALAVGLVVIGEETGMAMPSMRNSMGATAARPTRDEMARAARLYAGEFGGGVGVR